MDRRVNVGYKLMERGYYLIVMDHTSGKYIKQIRLAGHKMYFPNKYYSPDEFMKKLNDALADRYDLKVIEVKYIISKSKAMKDMDEHFSLGSIEPETNYNNIFDCSDEFMRNYILSEIVELVPPKDFNPNKFDEDNEVAKRKEEDKKIEEIGDSLKILTASNMSDALKTHPESLTKFRMSLHPSLKEGEVDIYIKATLTKPVEDLLESDKNSKNPIIVAATGKVQIKVHLHPCKNDNESIEMLANLCHVSDWQLCALLPPKNGDKQRKKEGVTYWSVSDVSRRAEVINNSIKAVNYLSIHKNKRGNDDSIQFYSFLFNQIVIKATINLAQIKRIQQYFQNDDEEYYLHLAYPPRYFISLLKYDTACDDGFIRNWERAENFMFLRNENIMKDEFLRLYLFNNTIFKVKLSSKDVFPTIKARQQLLNIIRSYKGSIQHARLEYPIKFTARFTTLSTLFKYENFKNKFETIGLFHDKIWKLKYLILVLVRYGSITPNSVEALLARIEESKEDIDIFIYIFWQSVIALATVAPETRDEDFFKYLQTEYEQIKKLKIKDITDKVGSNTDMISYVFKASLTPSGYLYNPPTPEMKGRLMKQYTTQSEFFMRVAIVDDNEGSLKNQKYITKCALKDMMSNIMILNRKYIPLGWSPSQLRSYSLWYMHEFENKTGILRREQVLSFLGDFSKISNPARKAARIGQAFSASWTYLCKQGEIKQKIIDDDRSTKGYLFTDGIGKISANLLQRLSLKLKIRDLSVIQVRYKGAKGILVLDRNLENNMIQLRPSMVKYDCNHDSASKYLDILDWNKYKAGFLNRQTIVLLKSLGISDKVFERLQQEHIERISSLSFKDCSIFKHMNEDLNTDINNLEPANITILHLLRAGFKLQNEPFFRGVLQTMKKNGYNQLKVKSNVLIKKSARIIGIIDQHDILREGELYCTLYDHLSLEPIKENVEGDVIITRNPCLHPADMRKMKCVGTKEIGDRFSERGKENIFEEFVNCIIFPKQGDIPVTAQISGSDLDGDNFFISWEPALIPKAHDEIYLIDAPITDQANNTSKVPEEAVDIQKMYDKMLDFFIEYLNYEKLGQIDNSHLVKADKSPFYAKEEDCLELAKIHGKAVDFPKTGFCPPVDPKLLVSVYPDFMEKEECAEYESTSILGRLYRDIKERIQNLLKDCEVQKTVKIDSDLISELATEDMKIDQYEKSEISDVLRILLDYEREMLGLINLVGVDTEYEIYSGNFSIAKDKVKNFGKNRLIATILALRAKYFDRFFANLTYDDKQAYMDASQKNLEKADLFNAATRKRALLFYIASYLIKFHFDDSFLDEDKFAVLRKMILEQYKSMSMQQIGEFCGFVWFVIPKIIINQKYRVARLMRNMEKMPVVEVKKEQAMKKKEAVEEPEQESDQVLPKEEIEEEEDEQI